MPVITIQNFWQLSSMCTCVCILNMYVWHVHMCVYVVCVYVGFLLYLNHLKLLILNHSDIIWQNSNFIWLNLIFSIGLKKWDYSLRTTYILIVFHLTV